MYARKILHRSSVFIAVLFIALVVVVNLSETETALSCKGEFILEGQTHSGDLYVSLNEYRWWVGLWSSGSDGNMHVEMPDGYLLYFYRLKELKTVWHIYGGRGEQELKGSYSKLSKSLKLGTPFGLFEGTCAATTRAD